MSRAALVIAACLATGVALAADVAKTASGPVIQFAGTQPTCSIRLAVTVNGKSPDAAWEVFLQRLFEFYDHDGNGLLSGAEAAHMPPLPLADRKVLVIDFGKLDRDSKGAATKSDLTSFCRDGGFVPVVSTVESPSDDDLRLAALFARILDADRDGKVTKAALLRLVESLRPHDLNDDETWEVSELLASAPAQIPRDNKPTMTVTTTSGEVGAELRVSLGSKAQAALARDKSEGQPPLTVVDLSDGVYRLDGPHRRWSAMFRASLDLPDVRSNGQFLTAQFEAALGSGPSLAKAQAAEDDQLGALRSLFVHADHNSDSRLSLAELGSYLQLVELALGSQIWTKVHDSGGNLFPALDVDGDGRLSNRELTRASHVLTDESAEPQVLPRQFRMSFNGPEARSWGGVSIPSTKRSSRSGAVASSSPRWFQAQDANHDGILSRREFLGTPEVFRKLDNDGDGIIVPQEALGGVKP